MRIIRSFPVAGLLVGLMVLLLPAAPASGALVEGAVASGAGLRVRADLGGNTLVNFGPTPFVKVPDVDDTPNEAEDTIVGPVRIPGDSGALISDIRALSVSASRSQTGLPTATGEAQTARVALIEQGGTPLLEVDAIHSVSKTTCKADGTAAVSAEGSRLVGLSIAGRLIDATPEPNTVIPLVSDGGTPADPSDDRGIRIILNEQTGATRGTGLIVTMIHVLVFDTATSNVVLADIRIAQAMSAVFCSEASPPTNDNGDDRGVETDKEATSTTSDPAGSTDGTRATAHRGEQVTWTLTITNTGDVGCGIVTVVDTLPRHFSFVSSAGDLTKAVAPVVEDRTITWNNADRWSVAPGSTLTERIVAKVPADAPFGTYTNQADIDTSTCSTFTLGLGGPVDVIPKASVLPSRFEQLPTTGSPVLVLLVTGFGLVTMGGLAVTTMRDGK